MAEKVIAVDLVIDSGESLNDLKLVEDKLKLIEKSIKEVNSSDEKGLENQLKAMDKLVEDNNLSWNELSKTIEQYQSIALSAGKESPIGKEALKKAGALKSEMDNLSRSVNSLATNGQNLNTALQVSQGVVAGYTAVQSVTALVGEENEELVETLVKLQSAQGLLASIEQVRFALEKDSLIVLKAKTIWEKAVAVSTALMTKANLINTTATQGATIATRVFTVALLAVPFVAIVAGLVLLYNNFDKVSESVRGAVMWLVEMSENFKELEGWGKVLATLFLPFLKTVEGVTKALQYFGVVETETQKKVREANNKIIKDYQDREGEVDNLIVKQQHLTDTTINQLDREIAVRKAQGKDVTALEQEKLKILEASALRELQLMKQKVELFAQEIILRLRNNNITRAQYEEQVEQFDELGKKLQQSVENYEDAKNNIIVYEETITTNLRNEADKRSEIKRQEREKENTAREEQLEKDKEFLIRYNEETEALKEEQRIAKREKDVADQMQASLEDVERYKQQQAEIVEADRLAQEQKKQNLVNGLENSQQALNMLSSLNQAFLKNDLAKAGNNEAKKEQIRKASFEREKKLNIAKAAINGAQAVMQALANMPPPLSYIMAGGSAILAGVQIAAIKKQKYNSSGSVPSMSGALSSATSNISSSSNTSNTNTEPNTVVNTADIINDNNTPQQVLVVDDFNKVNENQNLIESASSI